MLTEYIDCCSVGPADCYRCFYITINGRKTFLLSPAHLQVYTGLSSVHQSRSCRLSSNSDSKFLLLATLICLTPFVVSINSNSILAHGLYDLSLFVDWNENC